MPQSKAIRSQRLRQGRRAKSKSSRTGRTGIRYSVGLPSTVVAQVERYAENADISMSKAIASLVRLGVESQASRKREFFSKLKQNLANDDPKQQDRLVDEFRDLILGR